MKWLDDDPQWQRLVKQRMDGGITEYNYKISSQEALHTNSTETNEVKANFDYMMVKVNGDYDSEHDSTFSSNQDIEWSIHVKFANKNEMSHLPKIKILTPGNKDADDFLSGCEGGIAISQRPDLTDPPLRLVADDVAQLNDCVIAKGLLIGGRFNNSEHVIVETNGISHDATVTDITMFKKKMEPSVAEPGDYLGVCLSDISIKDVQIGSIIYKATEYEKFKGRGNKASSGKLSDVEHEYVAEVMEYLEDYSTIGVNERKRLERTRNRLNISECRAAELESTIVTPQLSSEEKEYLEEVKEYIEDYGTIGSVERKHLEKSRKRLGISEERAGELEKMVR